MEKCGKIGCLSWRIWPHRRNIAQADVARLGSVGFTLSHHHLFKDKIVKYVKKEYIIGSIQMKEFFRNMNLSLSYCKMNETTSFAITEGLLLN